MQLRRKKMYKTTLNSIVNEIVTAEKMYLSNYFSFAYNIINKMSHFNLNKRMSFFHFIHA